jgi:hypothetical protein
MPGFRDCIKEVWDKRVPDNHNPMGVLHIKLCRAAKALIKWSKSLMNQIKVALAICREVIAQLEKAQEVRSLSIQERELIKQLKHRILGLAAIHKSQARQRSRMIWLQKGDANTKLFHLMANSRKKKNHIRSLQSENGVAFSQADKHKVIFNHFPHHMGSYNPRSCSLN